MAPTSSAAHCLIFNQKPKTFNDLPLRLVDFGRLHRANGACNDVKNPRSFTQDDATVFAEDDMDNTNKQVKAFLQSADRVAAALGLEMNPKYIMRPADAAQRRAGTDAQWDNAEREMGGALDERGKEYAYNAPGLAPVGPRVEAWFKDTKGKEWQGGYIECDFELAARLGCQYEVPEHMQEEFNNRNKDINIPEEAFAAGDLGSEAWTWKHVPPTAGNTRPLVFRRSILGPIERFMANLIESNEGKMPLFMSSRQVLVRIDMTAMMFGMWLGGVHNYFSVNGIKAGKT